MTIKSATLRMPQRRIYAPSSRKRRAARSLISIPAGFSIRAAAALLVLSLFLGLSFVTSYRIHGIAQDIRMLEERYSALNQENLKLSAEFSTLASRQRLARIGRKLGLSKPGQDQVVTLR